jgi:hypothetical protein
VKGIPGHGLRNFATTDSFRSRSAHSETLASRTIQEEARRAATANGRVTANCEPGERATGGGAHSVNGAVVASAPAADPDAIFVSTGITFQGYTPTSWTAAAKDAGGAATDVTAWVVCATP